VETHGRAQSSDTEENWAELADLILIIAREIQFRGYANKEAVALSPSEGMVMRYLQDAVDASPSRVAAATGLQRTNLSTVLRGLERKHLIERHGRVDDARAVVIHLTDLGRTNYDLVRHEWAAVVAGAAAADARNLDASIALLRTVKDGLTAFRTQDPL
jgi:DNA-binding MarR family transcriptional regulator